MSTWLRRILAMLVLLAPKLHAQGAIEGTAFDSLRGIPFSNASVIVRAAVGRDTTFRSALTDNRGRFQLVGLPEGKYFLAIDHESIDSIGYHIPDVTVDVGYLKTTSVSIATPSARTIRHVLCPDVVDDKNTGVILGVVRRIDGTPVPNAAVVFSWNDFEVDQPSVSVISHRETVNGKTDANGVYRQCGLPISRSIFVQAQGEARTEQSGILKETIGPSGMLLRDFRIAETAMAADDTSESKGRFKLAGTITDVRDKPIARATVSLAGSGRTAQTNEDGEFRFANAPGGTRSIEIIALGYYPRSLNVEVDGSAAPVRVRMERSAVILDSLNVIAKRTMLARRLSHEEFDDRRTGSPGGYYLTRAQIDSMRPMSTVDALRRTQGLRLTQAGRVGEFVISSSRAPGDNCPMDIYLDGMRVKQEDLRGIPPEFIYGIEVQGVATIPAKYKASRCGAVFIWTR